MIRVHVHPPIFARVLAEYAGPDVLDHTDAVGEDMAPKLFLRGFAAYLALAESLSGEDIDGSTYRLLIARQTRAYARQAAARIIRDHPHGVIYYPIP